MRVVKRLRSVSPLTNKCYVTADGEGEDSRVWGEVRRDMIVGKVYARLYPFKWYGDEWWKEVRWGEV